MRRTKNLFLNTVNKRVPDLCKAGVYTSFKTWGNEWAWSVSTVRRKKSTPLQIAGKLQCAPTDNGFNKILPSCDKQSDKLVQPIVTRYLCKSGCWQSPGLAKQCLSFDLHVNERWHVNNFDVQSVKIVSRKCQAIPTSRSTFAGLPELKHVLTPRTTGFEVSDCS